MEQQRLLMVQEHEEGASISELARIYGVSRNTVYKWLKRHEQDGAEGLGDLSRRPHESPSRICPAAEKAIFEARLRWKWGPRKLRVKLCQQDADYPWPSVSSIASVLKNRGLIVSRKRRVRTPVQIPPYVSPETSNSVWCADYKGHFRTGDGTRIDPLTITDAASRYLLRCQIVERTDFAHAQAVFEAAFRQFGMPEVIHTDNGVPFASIAPGGLSRLSIWFIKLGILPERSRPGTPQDNGRHERMHRTLKQATASPPQPTARLQQKAFDAFTCEFNQHRPHEALGDLTPAACYNASSRVYPPRVPEIHYADHLEIRRVSQQGSIRWKGERTFISEVLGYETLGLQHIDGRWLQVFFGPVSLGWFDGYRHRFTRLFPRELNKPKPSSESNNATINLR